ncbi:hypothetical protein HYS96_00665 [Candidatus Daviesbacteria bacterium]|nr:hypothetical protein [Candidatus Daviesbacteria bacterium]
MQDYIWFTATKTFVRNQKWLWVPYLHSLNGKNLFWPNKGFETQEKATDYMKMHLNQIKQDYF